MKTAMHFTDNYLINPTNPVRVALIGAGGTGSQMLTALARINHCLTTLNHAGLQVTVFDNDTITRANMGRQLFAESELALYKSVALVNRINRFFGTGWKTVPRKFTTDTSGEHPASIYISCVDNVQTRFEIADILKGRAKENNYAHDKPLYWLDAGNANHTGQVILSTVSEIRQPKSELYDPVGSLPMVTDEFKTLLENEAENDQPSCSLAEALEKQDLFINSTIADMGGALLWQLFRYGMTENRGFFHNLNTYHTQPIKVAKTA